MLRLLRIMA
jgi:hypothetical protein